MKNTNKFIVITSIFQPSEAVKKFALLHDWQLVVVGDKKTPADWQCDNVVYLGPEDQEKLGFEITKVLPWNHYCRKMVGYLYSISQGAEAIFDTDDDNIPKPNWPAMPEGKSLKALSGEKFVNIYKYFTDEPVWPRGFPLDRILSDAKPNESQAIASERIGVWQFLADEDPDVDAIYRLTNDKPIYFKDNEPLALAKNTVCPFNSQNTAFIKEMFPLLYLPAFVTFRFTDILRGLVAQPLMWQHDFQLGFGPATVVQKRNPHDYMKDFESEIPVYVNAEKVIDIVVKSLDGPATDILDRLSVAYSRLRESDIVGDDEIKLLEAWTEDIKTLHTHSS